METEQSIISYKGVVSADLLTSVLNIMEDKLAIIEESVSIRKKVYNVLVECLQNLYHHNEGKGTFTKNAKQSISSDKASILIISKPADFYEIKTGNFIENQKVEKLKSKINHINNLDKEGLRDLYVSILNDGEYSNKGTAGLGLIDIARKSNKKIEYEFKPINDQYSFYCLNVKIN